MTDRELLELAAEAAGIERRYYSDPTFGSGMIDDDPDGGLWNPLTDDADAFRLVVNLKITVEQSILENKVSAYVLCRQVKRHWVEISGCADRAEATRRAITRAAAEIGKQKEQP